MLLGETLVRQISKELQSPKNSLGALFIELLLEGKKFQVCELINCDRSEYLSNLTSDNTDFDIDSNSLNSDKCPSGINNRMSFSFLIQSTPPYVHTSVMTLV